MLIIAPPSESKRRDAADGPPVDLATLSFPELTPMRATVLDALIATSARADAFGRLQVGPSLAEEVARNTWLREAPARPAQDVYVGPLHQGLGLATLGPSAAGRASGGVVIVSALWGALRPLDRIPPYRLHVCSRLVGLDRLEPAWRSVLPDALATAAGSDGVVLDLRSAAFQAVGMPAIDPERLVHLHVAQGNGRGRVGDVVAKRVRGEAARMVLEAGTPLDDPRELAGMLGERWPANLAAPTGPRRTWSLTLSTAAS